MSFDASKDAPARFFRLVAILNGLAVVFVLGVYAYGGWYSRYLADDYCHAAYLFTSRNVIEASLKSYNDWMGRYSVLFFVQVVEWAGMRGFQFMTGATLLLWLSALVWLMAEIGKAFEVRHNPAIRLWVSALAVFLSLYQAPALYQILYWRAGLPYTLPLPLFAGLAAFILWYARQAYRRSRAIWAGLVCSILVFVSSGLGETTAALQTGVLACALLIVWWTRTQHQRMDIAILLAVSLMGAVCSLLIIALAPGTSIRMGIIMVQPPIYNPMELSVDVIRYTVLFLWDAFRVAPIPNLIALIVPFGIFYFQCTGGGSGKLSKMTSSQLCLAIALILICMFIIIGCSFAPSAFLRSYPVARARYAAHFIVTLSLILEGGLLGVLAGRMKMKFPGQLVRNLVALVLGLLALYPLYAATKVYAATAEYRRFASAWDVRDAQIRQAIAEGATELSVVQLDSIGGVGEYKGNRIHWINVCAAQYYGLDSLIAP